MSARRLYRIEEAASSCGVRTTVILEFIEREWLHPALPKSTAAEESDTPPSSGCAFLDEEDLARARLIRELRESLGVNDEAVPIILSLLDQLHCLRREARRRSAA